ncbi:MAG: TVP38/TMEM64 family protein [Deltaproteobacteria bacterium]|nr:TVP38/TMEM64 family protein [Deltaproteobacteria bacterium]
MNSTRFSGSRKKFIKFILFLIVGWTAGFFIFSRCMDFTPETFHQFIVSLGILGPAIYISFFIIRPFFFISSIALFIAGGLAFGPVWGPSFAAFGAAVGGALGFCFARIMGHEYVYGILKNKKHFIDNQKFSFSIVLLLSLLPIMPITIINFGAGLSDIKFRPFIIAHVLGITPRAFVYGFFGSTLFATGSLKFKIALIILLVMVLLTIYFVRKSNQKLQKDQL